MARTAKSAEEKSPFVELVSPDGNRKETPLNAARDAQLRFTGYLPEDRANLEAPKVSDSGSSTLTGAEKTVSTPTPTGGN